MLGFSINDQAINVLLFTLSTKLRVFLNAYCWASRCNHAQKVVFRIIQQKYNSPMPEAPIGSSERGHLHQVSTSCVAVARRVASNNAGWATGPSFQRWTGSLAYMQTRLLLWLCESHIERCDPSWDTGLVPELSNGSHKIDQQNYKMSELLARPEVYFHAANSAFCVS